MTTKLFVGNLPFRSTEQEVRELFEQFGEVQSVNLVADRHTGQPRGFGFVEMPDEAAREAISKLGNTDFGGRTLRVDVARSRQ